VRLALSLLALPLIGALLANGAALAIHDLSWLDQWDAVQILVRVAPLVAVTVGLYAAACELNARSTPAEAAWVGTGSAALTFALAWVPAAVLLIVAPPT
jgi:hypothetical protein